MTGKAADIDVAEVKCTPGEIVLTWQNSSFSVYTALWLRDNDPANRDPLTGQRLMRTVDLPGIRDYRPPTFGLLATSR